MKQTIDFVKIKATLSVQIERLPNDQLPTVINRKTLCNALRLYRDFENLFYNHQQIANAIHATNNA
ncbi:MAG: hypothetical protein J7502_19330, partial [Flavisolibacter sp.]|nr:hypothetical protein [Flavisolibacter sp.]